MPSFQASVLEFERHILTNRKHARTHTQSSDSADKRLHFGRRTKCLKQYCQCFRNDVRCTAECV